MPHHPSAPRLTSLLAVALLLIAPATVAEENVFLVNWPAAPFWTRPAEVHTQETAAPRGARQALAVSSTPLPFVALAPCRLVDTRGGAPLTGGFLPPATPRSYALTGVCNIPATAQAVSLNATVVRPTGPGFLTLWPDGGTFPPVSTLNYVGGDIVANAAIVPLSVAGAISIALGGSGGDVILDTNGYYAPVASVTTLNSRTGDVTLAPGGNVSILQVGNTFTIGAGPLVSSLKGLTGTVDVVATNGLSASAGSGAVTVTSNATPTDVPGTIVSRDPAGDFGSRTVTLSGDLTLPVTSPTSGRVFQNASPLLHTFGTDNVFLGANAGNLTMTGNQNMASGTQALLSNTTGSFNTASGYQALLTNGIGDGNTASGAWGLSNNTTGSFNTAIGYQALSGNTTAGQNVAIGTQALFSNTSGEANTAGGYQSLRSNLTGLSNTAYGSGALSSNTAGNFNTACGGVALINATTGNGNIAVGYDAGSNLTTGDNNIVIGHAGFVGESGTTRIGTPGQQTRAFVAGIRGVTTGSGDAIPVLVDSAGQLGTISSSARFKEDVRGMGEASAKILDLRPVTFRYRGRPDVAAERHYGLIAEEVDEVIPELVARSADGQVETVKYHELPAMLLNEVQRLTATVRELEERLARAETKLADTR